MDDRDAVSDDLGWPAAFVIVMQYLVVGAVVVFAIHSCGAKP